MKKTNNNVLKTTSITPFTSSPIVSMEKVIGKKFLEIPATKNHHKASIRVVPYDDFLFYLVVVVKQ